MMSMRFGFGPTFRTAVWARDNPTSHGNSQPFPGLCLLRLPFVASFAVAFPRLPCSLSVLGYPLAGVLSAVFSVVFSPLTMRSKATLALFRGFFGPALLGLGADLLGVSYGPLAAAGVKAFLAFRVESASVAA